ncbi:MAG: TetR/AcrR family transcriptional regulator, partial [Thermoguttaceae bacterium]|nr:TetR/AcrR family transcriptional regulator [Thermoguttaceae bacterium]
MDTDKTAVFPSFNMPPTERGKARWRKVVNTAKRLFEERGYNEVSLAEIVRESGGSFATVYRWFGNKDDLFLCVVLDHISKVHEIIESTPLSGATAQEDVEALVGKLVA